MTNPPVLCVFCGASPGTSPAHLEAAAALARAMHEHGMTLVYGGGTNGLMGQVARTLVSLSGPDAVHGIIPRALMQYEQADDPEAFKDASKRSETPPTQMDDDAPRAGSPEYTSQYGRMTIVADMHTRKRMMAEQVIAGGPGSGFVALSGGYGTLEELMEITTWNQLGIHSRGVAIFNVEGYWDGLVQWIQNSVQAGFVDRPNGRIIQVASSAEEVIELLAKYKNSPTRLSLDWKAEGTLPEKS